MIRSAQSNWAVTPKKVATAIHTLVRIADPLKIILFGSYVRDDIGKNSDLDILVVTRNDVPNQRHESVRLRRALKGISMPMDILIISKKDLTEVADTPGLIYREIVRNGKVIYECAG